jgi:two-component system response regulator DevR
MRHACDAMVGGRTGVRRPAPAAAAVIGRGLARLRLEPRLGVLIAESRELVRLGLRSLLAEHQALEVVGEVSTVAGAVAAAVERRPALVLIAAVLGDGTGLDGCRAIRARVPEARVVILGEPGEGAAPVAARAGALGWLSGSVDARSVGRLLCDAAAGARLPAAAPPGRDLLALTGQERRVLGLVAQGKTNKEIGSVLGLSEKTVKNYLSHAFEKLSVTRRAQAAVLFIRRYGARPAVTGATEAWRATG